MNIVKRIVRKIKTVLNRSKKSRVDKDSVPTMLTKAEQDYLFRYMAEFYSNEGVVVDLGCWMGGSTIPLAQGLRSNNKRLEYLKVIHSFDLFEWTPWMASNYGSIAPKLEIGDSFVSVYKKNISRWKDLIHVHEGDLNQVPWTGNSIELLFVDAMKSWDLANGIVSKFYPYLIPGKSMVIHQDFVHWNTPWILLLTYQFRDYLKAEEWVVGSTSVVFKCIERPTEAFCNKDYSFESFSDQEIQDAFSFCRSLMPKDTPPRFMANLEASEINCHIYRWNLDYANNAIEKANEKYKGLLGELVHLKPRLNQVEVLRQLLIKNAPLSISDLCKMSFLGVDEIQAAIEDLIQMKFIEVIKPENKLLATNKGKAWTNRSFASLDMIQSSRIS